MFPSLPPVVLNTQVVHLHTVQSPLISQDPSGCNVYIIYQRGATVVDNEKEKADKVKSGEDHKEDAYSLQHEAEQIELHGNQVPVLPLGLSGFRQTRHIVILVFYEPKRRKVKNASALCVSAYL